VPIQRTGKYGDFDGYTSDDRSSKDGDGDTSFQWSQFTTQCSHLMFPRGLMTPKVYKMTPHHVICDGPHRARDCLKKASLNGMSEAWVRALVDSGMTHNFIADNEAKRLGISATKGRGTIKVVNSEAKPINGVSKDIRANIGEWEGTIDLLVVLMDDFKVVLGLEFLDKRDAKSEAYTLSAMQFKKGFNKSEPYYLAVTRLETDEGSSKVEVLQDNKLYVKLKKCSFAQDEVEFLGHKIKDGGLMMDEAKIKAIQDWEPPTKS
ncbi:putative retrotransposon gag domain, aspartic peptidase domain protein, partial [Tanacetum coccineum]